METFLSGDFGARRNTTQIDPFVFVIIRTSVFFKLVFLYNTTKKKNNNVIGLGGI